MATIIRHGPAGSYKSSYAVWFEILPALRSGRCVLTNIEGMEDLETIEKSLGERFPPSARIIRISSQTTKGKNLWQNWYNWVPLGALIVIDEVQDIFNKSSGFNMSKNLFQGIEPFVSVLPEWYFDFYQRVKSKFKPSDPYVDDLGEKIVDENGNIIMPENFEEAFQRHRKYNWDLILCTPNIKALGDEVKSVSEVAVAHSSRDGILPWSKRKTRLFQHDPRCTGIKPTKDDAVDIQKIPVAVHLLYRSTATGEHTKARKGRPLWKEPRLMMAVLALAIGFGVSFDGFMGLNNESSNNAPLPTEQKNSADTQLSPASSPTDSLQTQAPNQNDTQMGSNFGSFQTPKLSNGRFIDRLTFHFPLDIEKLYVSSVVTRFHTSRMKSYDVTFEGISLDGEHYYINSETLFKLGYIISVVDTCLVKVSYDNITDYFHCNTHRPKPPRPQQVQLVNNNGQRVEALKEQGVAIFPAVQ
ncbi:zonular occludens toxin [Vibrio vulnificus]|uniref:zonular occludens toxin domain-containing protein n=1 Tax=Vibrio vulnificus TaxID=672 RepID=UPI001EEA2E01|nr:zonular occludens toxin domain-containing protein [Vibrio vulnificus]EIT7028696.1 zonular occludens toxin [Vibrio vulnificus]MCG6290236.1 zonular occludens toxin [Vibrio vulnificus]